MGLGWLISSIYNSITSSNKNTFLSVIFLDEYIITPEA
jgi:hypothetical protein